MSQVCSLSNHASKSREPSLSALASLTHSIGCHTVSHESHLHPAGSLLTSLDSEHATITLRVTDNTSQRNILHLLGVCDHCMVRQGLHFLDKRSQHSHVYYRCYRRPRAQVYTRLQVADDVPPDRPFNRDRPLLRSHVPSTHSPLGHISHLRGNRCRLFDDWCHGRRTGFSSSY